MDEESYPLSLGAPVLLFLGTAITGLWLLTVHISGLCGSLESTLNSKLTFPFLYCDDKLLA